MDELLKRASWKLIITTSGILGGMEGRKEVYVDSWDDFQSGVEYALKNYLDDENATDFFLSIENGLRDYFFKAAST